MIWQIGRLVSGNYCFFVVVINLTIENQQFKSKNKMFDIQTQFNLTVSITFYSFYLNSKLLESFLKCWLMLMRKIVIENAHKSLILGCAG